jgi:hypothetical protein
LELLPVERLFNVFEAFAAALRPVTLPLGTMILLLCFERGLGRAEHP